MTSDAPTRLAKGLGHLALLIAVLVSPTACRFEQDLGESLHSSDAIAGDLGRGDDATDAAESPIDAAIDRALDLLPLIDGPGTCAPGRIFCTPECIDPMTALKNCGTCHVVCTFGMQICLFGMCSRCVNGTNCDNACVHLSTDVNHCGTCTHQCAAGQSCMNGICQ